MKFNFLGSCKFNLIINHDLHWCIMVYLLVLISWYFKEVIPYLWPGAVNPQYTGPAGLSSPPFVSSLLEGPLSLSLNWEIQQNSHQQYTVVILSYITKQMIIQISIHYCSLIAINSERENSFSSITTYRPLVCKKFHPGPVDPQSYSSGWQYSQYRPECREHTQL